MSHIQAIEERDYSESARYDRFQGYDRGDLDFDYEAAQQDDNEAFEAEMRAAGLI